MSDEQLAMCCKQGEKQAMEQLIEKYYLPLKAFFYKHTYDAAVSEDLTHNVVVKFIQGVEKYHPVFGAKFSTWLFKIAYNEYLNHRQRSPLVREVPLDESISEAADSTDISQIVENRLIQQALKEKLDALPEELKTLIVLRYYSMFSYKEIAKITGNQTGRVKWKLHEAVERLRSAVKTAEGGMKL